ncbi:MAG TPA: cell division protein ZapA [Nitrospirota bacterium]|nr:cell division protein ZapA [Nitrospirota bacterium]
MDPVQVKIYGQVYSLKGTDNADHIRALAEFIDAKMKEIEKGTGTIEPHRVSILASLTIADELFHLRAEYEKLGATAQNAVKRLLTLTDTPETKTE